MEELNFFDFAWAPYRDDIADPYIQRSTEKHDNRSRYINSSTKAVNNNKSVGYY